jgi:manganese transport protein
MNWKQGAWIMVKEGEKSDLIGTVRVPENALPWKTLLAYVGPGLLVAVGYMDPGNWATDLAGGAQFGYLLLCVIWISSGIAMLLQYLALKLGIVTGLDLAQACRAEYPKTVVLILWILCEIAIVACDLAEVIGSAVALNLLFRLPLAVGVVLTAADVLIILLLQSKGFRYVEALVGMLILLIALSFFKDAHGLGRNARCVVGDFVNAAVDVEKVPSESLFHVVFSIGQFDEKFFENSRIAFA